MSGWRLVPSDTTKRPGEATGALQLRRRTVRVVVLDDTTLYRDTLAMALRQEVSIDAVTTAADADEARQRLDEAHPTVVLLNMAMDRSADVLAAVAGSAPHPPVVALAVPETEEAVIGCAEAGVAGYLLRTDSLDELVAVIHSVARGETLCSPRVTATLLRRVATLATERQAQVGQVRLTAREQEVLRLLDEGLSNKQIGRRLSIEVRTVKNHVHHILAKLQVHSRAEAAARLRSLRPAPARARGRGLGTS